MSVQVLLAYDFFCFLKRHRVCAGAAWIVIQRLVSDVWFLSGVWSESFPELHPQKMVRSVSTGDVVRVFQFLQDITYFQARFVSK